MHNLRRGLRSILRSPIRTVVVSLLVGLGLALAIMSLALNQALDQQVDQLAGEMGTELQLRPAGNFGGFGSEETTLTEALLEEIAVLPHVASIEKVLTVNLPREQGRATLTGIESTETLSVFGGGSAALSAGRHFTQEDQGQKVAIISAEQAVEQDLEIGDTYSISDTEFEVVGLFESEIRFGRMSTFVPLQTLQEFSEQAGLVSQAIVTADRVENVEALADAIRNLAGEETDIIVPQERQLSMYESTLSNLTGSNSTNLIVALSVAGITIFFTLLLAVRERSREIGILKALGASARDLVTGFAWEGLTLAVLGCLVGILIFGTAGQAAAGWFLDSAAEASASPTEDLFPGPGGGRGGLQGRLGNMFNPSALITDNLQVSLSADIVATVFAAALALGTLGGVLPALLALRMKPAEVLRND